MRTIHKIIIVFLVAYSGYANATKSSFGKSSSSKPSAVSQKLNVTSQSKFSGFAKKSPRKIQGSLLNNGRKPSDKVANIIRQKENSGPGWIGTAFLISLLSRHDLSTTDRRWIQSKIHDIQSEQILNANNVNTSLATKIVMQIDALSEPLQKGQLAKFNVSFRSNQKSVDQPKCFIDGTKNKLTASHKEDSTNIEWIPDQEGVFIMQCYNDNYKERRILYVKTNV